MTLAHQTTQNGTLTKSGLLKSGNLVKCWKQEWGDTAHDKFIVYDVDMDCDTVTESDFSFKNQIILAQGGRIRLFVKIQNSVL